MSSRLIEVPLGLELVFPGGRVQHDFSRLPAPGVVRSLARAHLSLTNSGGGIKTRGTSALYARAIRRMAAFFDRELDGERLAALDEAAYRRMIPSLGGEDLEGCVRALLLRCAEIDPDAVHSSVRPLLVAPYLLEQTQSVPIAPLSGAEAKLLESTCKAVDSGVRGAAGRGRAAPGTCQRGGEAHGWGADRAGDHRGDRA